MTHKFIGVVCSLLQLLVVKRIRPGALCNSSATASLRALLIPVWCDHTHGCAKMSAEPATAALCLVTHLQWFYRESLQQCVSNVIENSDTYGHQLCDVDAEKVKCTLEIRLSFTEYSECFLWHGISSGRVCRRTAITWGHLSLVLRISFSTIENTKTG